ncbi:hypothetical protein U9M48_038619 [Paspalum notatum var. saurae]|uniref:Uncharacterized protein n=1 Tax=Paspalum notatum var. saurae TaxID=547442 RepID=A0AAQ3UH79_PASNO
MAVDRGGEAEGGKEVSRLLRTGGAARRCQEIHVPLPSPHRHLFFFSLHVPSATATDGRGEPSSTTIRQRNGCGSQQASLILGSVVAMGTSVPATSSSDWTAVPPDNPKSCQGHLHTYMFCDNVCN